MALFRRRRSVAAQPDEGAAAPTVHAVAAGDEGFAAVLAAACTPRGAARAEATRSIAAWLREVASRREIEFVALDGADGAPVGVAWLAPLPDEPTTLEAWIVVDPVARHFGVGEQLWEHLEARALQWGGSQLVTVVLEADGAAFAFRHAFDPCERLPGTLDLPPGFPAQARQDGLHLLRSGGMGQ